ncbi:MAG: tetratricopeptide repeat protein [Spirochaetota bacterium]
MSIAKNYFFLTLCLLFFFQACGQIKSDKGNVENLLEKASKNIATAESLSDIARKNNLMKTAESQVQEADTLSVKLTEMQGKVNSVYAYLYFVNGDYTKAKKFAEKNKDKNDPFMTVLNTRISLKEKGSEFARNAIGRLEPVLTTYPRNAMARLTLGDCHFLLGNFQDAQKQYTEVLKIGEAFQVLAADRLEVMDQIRRTGVDTGKVQNVILSLYVRRDEAADILKRIYNADRYLKFGKTGEKNFKDIIDSLYADSIRILREKGFFTYISGDNFEPYKIVTRSEIAMIVEDFIVLQSGNTSLRTRFLKDAKSTIKGIDVKDPYYNAIKTAIDAKAMVISLDGSINPLEPVSGLETIGIFSKLIK